MSVSAPSPSRPWGLFHQHQGQWIECGFFKTQKQALQTALAADLRLFHVARRWEAAKARSKVKA